MTPKKYQSGETDVTGRIAKTGDGGVRTPLYEAANVILTRPVKGSTLKSWGMRLAARGMRKAKGALARKLAVVLHCMLADGTESLVGGGGRSSIRRSSRVCAVHLLVVDIAAAASGGAELVELGVPAVCLRNRCPFAGDSLIRRFFDAPVAAFLVNDHIGANSRSLWAAQLFEDGPYLAARDLLLRETPRTGGQPLHRPGQTAVEAAVRLSSSLRGGILPIQGPPGAGKTYTGAHMICAGQAVDRGPTLCQHERRSGAGIFCRRDGRGRSSPRAPASAGCS